MNFLETNPYILLPQRGLRRCDINFVCFFWPYGVRRQRRVSRNSKEARSVLYFCWTKEHNKCWVDKRTKRLEISMIPSTRWAGLTTGRRNWKTNRREWRSGPYESKTRQSLRDFPPNIHKVFLWSKQRFTSFVSKIKERLRSASKETRKHLMT